MAKVTRTCFCYRIVRFFRVSGRRKIMALGLTRAQAMEHCSRPDTSRAGVWFDGFEMMPGYEDYTVAGVLPGAGAPAPDDALVYTRWQPDAGRDVFLPAMPHDEGGYWD